MMFLELTVNLWYIGNVFIFHGILNRNKEFDAVIQKVEGIDGAYVIFPYDIVACFGKKRVKVHAWFDDVAYDGSIVNMGVKDEHGNVCYIIGIRKDTRKQINKQPGDIVHVKITEYTL